MSQLMPLTYHLTYFQSMFDNLVEVSEDYTWEELTALFSEHRRTDKKNDLGFIAGTFKPPGEATPAKKPGTIDETIPGTVGRYGENVVAMHALCVDYDGGVTIDEVRAQLKGIKHLGYTSYNHLKDGVTHKFRVIIPFTTPCPAEEWKKRHKNFLPIFEGADPSTFMLARIFYAPSTPASEDRITLVWNEDGEAFDWTVIEPEVKQAPQPRITAGERLTDLTDLPYINTTKYGMCKADDLFDLMQEGYKHRINCYRIDDAADRKPGCFVVKRETGIQYFDTDGSKRFFKVLRTLKAPQAVPKSPDLVETIARLRERSRAALASKVENTLVFEEQPTIYELNDRYLPESITRVFPERGIVAIRSPKGSGKTERIADLVKDNKKQHRSTLLIGHRIHLLRNLSERTGLSNYQDQDEGTLAAMSAICLNSLGSRKPTHGPHYDTIIIDESEQVLQALVGEHLKPVRNEVYVAFADYIKHARVVVLLDADLTPGLTLEAIRLLRGDLIDDAAVGIINRFPIGQGRTTYQYADRHHLLRDALKDVADGEKVYYACNSINRATTIARAMETLGKRVLLVTSETGEKEHVRAFIESPAAQAIHYDALVTSPTLSTGVSIDAHNGVHHFTRVYGEFSLNPGTYLDADQALSRVRDETVAHRVWIQANTGADVVAKKAEDILDDYIERHRLSNLALPGSETKLSPEQYTWALLCTTIDTCVSEWSIFKPQQFRFARQELGWTFVSVAPSKAAIEEGKGAFNQHKPLTDGHAENVFDAVVLSYEDYHALTLKKMRTTAEGLAMERYRYTLELEKIGVPFTIENIEKAVKQNLLHSLRFARTHIIKRHDDRVMSDTESRRKNAITFTDVRHDVKRNELLRYLCTSAGLNFAQLHADAATGPVEVSSETLMKVAEAFVARQRECNLFFKSRIKDPTHEKSLVKVWNATIGAQTIPLTSKRVQVDGVKKRHHFIDYEACSLVLKVLDHDINTAVR